MKKDYGKVKSFRVDKQDEKLLNECFDMAMVNGDSFNAKMSYFIGRVHSRLKEIKDLQRRILDKEKVITAQEIEIRELKKQVPSPIKESKKPQPTENEVVTIPNSIKSSEVSKPVVYDPKEHHSLEKKIEQPMPKRWDTPVKPKDDLISCPYRDEWVHRVKCETCKAMRFKVYTDCQFRRIKNPNDPIFQISKPKPLV